MTAIHTDNPGNKPSLQPLLDMLADQMQEVNSTIIARMHSDVPLIAELGGHLIAAGGKRMRPLMTLAGAALVGADGDGRNRAIKLATAVEFIHSATLLHDDVIDESNLRRGHDTANALWGNEASVLVGDFLFARSFELMVETGNINVLGRLSNAAARITEGEIKQMAITGAPDTGMDAYLDVITGKTAILFAAAAAAGAEVGGGNSEDIAAMHEYGMQLGLAFQIMDDALDYAADAADMGKNTGDDFADQKITMPTIIAWQQGDAEERAFWQRTLGEANFAEGDLTIAQTLLAKHDAITLSLAAARDYAKQASDGVLAHCAKRGAGDQDASMMIGRALADAAIFAAARSS
jgi:octaprenyl-diphosphate synthase